MALNLPPLGGNSGGAHTQPSLPSLPAHSQSDTQLTAHLAERIHSFQIAVDVRRRVRSEERG